MIPRIGTLAETTEQIGKTDYRSALLSPEAWNLGALICPDPDVIKSQETGCPELDPVPIWLHLA